MSEQSSTSVAEKKIVLDCTSIVAKFVEVQVLATIDEVIFHHYV